ncbi:MAG: DMT family transporter [Verrucomicrobiia bacterium]
MTFDIDRGVRGPNSLSWRALLLLLCVVAVDTTSQLLLKSAVERAGTAVVVAAWPSTSQSPTMRLVYELLSEPRLYLATLLLCANFLIWARALCLVDLSVAVPVINLCLATVPVGAWLFLNEEISTQRWVGIFLIFVGVMICSTARGQPRQPPPIHFAHASGREL